MRVVWTLLWPLRQLGWMAVGVAEWVSDYYGDHTWLQGVSKRAWLAFMVGCALVILFEVGLVIFIAWQANTRVFLAVVGAVVASLMFIAVFRHQLVVALLVIGDVLLLLGHGLIAAKHHVCPPVEISRDRR